MCSGEPMVSLEIHRTRPDFPRIEQFALADQVRRASKSICANLAEGFGRQRLSKPEFRRFLVMAIGSAERWRGEYNEIARMLTSLHRGGSDI